MRYQRMISISVNFIHVPLKHLHIQKHKTHLNIHYLYLKFPRQMKTAISYVIRDETVPMETYYINFLLEITLSFVCHRVQKRIKASNQ